MPASEEYDARVRLKRNGMYEDAGINFDVERGKFWLFLASGDSVCIEAPELRGITEQYAYRLRESGLPSFTEDGHRR